MILILILTDENSSSFPLNVDVCVFCCLNVKILSLKWIYMIVCLQMYSYNVPCSFCPSRENSNHLDVSWSNYIPINKWLYSTNLYDTKEKKCVFIFDKLNLMGSQISSNCFNVVVFLYLGFSIWMLFHWMCGACVCVYISMFACCWCWCLLLLFYFHSIHVTRFPISMLYKLLSISNGEFLMQVHFCLFCLFLLLCCAVCCILMYVWWIWFTYCSGRMMVVSEFYRYLRSPFGGRRLVECITSSSTSNGKWSDGMCGWGQPTTLLSRNHSFESGPSKPSGTMPFFE